MMYERPAPKSRTDFVRDTIRDEILSGRFPPGYPLVEADLAEGFGVSKTPVREALKLLAGSGLVTISNYKGAVVRAVDAELVRSVYDLRALLEPEALARSVRREVDFFVARDALNEADTEDSAVRSAANRRFHRGLYYECGNPLLVDVLDGLGDRGALISATGWRLRATWAAETAEHVAILDAAEARDADRAAELLRGHITSFAAAFKTAHLVGEVRFDGR
ncbi:GntR family transcriptional regulator [Saccharothrix deserti]|uniref:GntR family transcriptional regulator n=1 Tax=Saccharothrix deserti TaxID=2593674 RepID=UPI00131AE762|nr:GntR family transcriptional regulator [Saccharothrix deserti]